VAGGGGPGGLEQTFNTQLTGKERADGRGLRRDGQKASEKIVIPPQPGANVITTLDEDAQRITEDALNKGAKRGAIVLVDATNGDIVAMASTPVLQPERVRADDLAGGVQGARG
jgi:penicillin-binding protein 2